MTGLLERAKELRDGAAVTHKAKDDAPNYHRVGNASLQRCGTCRHFTDSGRCDRYEFDADAMYTCDSWRPDIERLKKARVETETTKHLSHNQTTHGFRFGGAPSLEQARKYRKSGVMEQYAHRARQLSGKRSARDKNEEKRDKTEGDKSLDSAVRLGLVKDRAETVRIAKAAQRVQGGNWRTAVGRAIVAKSIENIRNRVEQGGERTEIYRKLLEELETTKEVSASPTAVYAHGPGGLFSPAGLGDTVATGRKRKKRKPARDGELFNAMITTKPGDKYRSIKNPKVYEALIAKGMPKSQAAAISNAMAKRGKRKKETAVTTLDYAIALKHASHSQASHGFRFGKTPSLEQARRYRKAGVLQEYSKRSRERTGTKPAKERNANKPTKPKQQKYKRGDTVEVTHRYGGLLPGMKGKVISHWLDPYGVGRVRLDMGANLSGQRLRQTIPTNSIMPVAANKEQKTQPPTFTVFKDKTGRYRWVAISSTAYRDRDGEIVSTKALADDVAHADTTGEYGTLRWWHVPGLDLGDCDFNMLYGRSLIESGTFKNDRIAERVKEKAHLLKLSLGFRHPADEPDKSGVFHTIRRFERSLIPPEGNASNLFTVLTVS